MLAVMPSNPIVSPLLPRMVSVPVPASSEPERVKSSPASVISPPFESMAPTAKLPPAVITIFPPDVVILSEEFEKDIFPVLAVKETLCPLVWVKLKLLLRVIELVATISIFVVDATDSRIFS